MFNKSELLNAIDDLEMSPATYQNAEKLATFYLLYDHLYTRKEPVGRVETVEEVIIDNHGDSDFLRLIDGKKAHSVWLIMDELIEAVQVLQPRLYEATIEELKQR